MSQERRRHQRFRYPLDATWRAASGAARSRVGDISRGGCFIESLVSPAPGERTTVAVKLGGRHFEISGVTRHVESGIGFSIEFDSLPPGETAALEEVLDMIGRAMSGETA